MCPPFRDALCFDFKVEWLLEINYMPSSPKMLRNCGDFFLCFKGEEAQYQTYYSVQLIYATSVLQLNCLI